MNLEESSRCLGKSVSVEREAPILVPPLLLEFLHRIGEKVLSLTESDAGDDVLSEEVEIQSDLEAVFRLSRRVDER